MTGCTATAPVSVPVFCLSLLAEVRSKSLLLALAVTYSSTALRQETGEAVAEREEGGGTRDEEPPVSMRICV